MSGTNTGGTSSSMPGWSGHHDRMTSAAWSPNTFLGGLPDATAKELVGLSTQRQFAPGRGVLREGDRDCHVGLRTSGFVKVTTSVEVFEPLLAIRVPRELVGEVGALTGQARNATVTTCGRV